MTKDNRSRETIIRNVIKEINDFRQMENSKVILSAFGCDVHLAYENIENGYASLCNKGQPSKAWGELRYDTVYLKLMDDTVNLTKDQVIEIIDYLNTWLKTKQKESKDASS